jgi:hypothetical protein
MAATRRPTIRQVRNASSVLARALKAEAEAIREREGARGHVTAQELGYDASRVESMASRIEALRRVR